MASANTASVQAGSVTGSSDVNTLAEASFQVTASWLSTNQGQLHIYGNK